MSNSRVLITNSDIVILAHGKDYDKAVFVVFSAGKKDYSDVLKDHGAFIDVCSKMNINLDVELVRVDEPGEKPFRSALSTLWKYYREYDEIHVYITPTEKTASTTLLALATLSLPVDSKKIRLIAEDIGSRVELNVNNYVKFLTLDEVEKKIIWYLMIWGDAKLSEIARALNKSKTTIYKKLKKLEKLSLVKQTETYTYRAENLINVYATI
jgi:CRISPR locus-related DNA-binding protein